jgi:fructokinase
MRIGIDLGGTKIEGVVLTDCGEELARRRVPTPIGKYRATLDAVAALVDRLEQETRPAASVGVGIPGAISPASGLVKNANATWLIGHRLDRDLAELLGRPVRVANDADCFATSEAADGAARGFDIVFGVILGTGVGGGIVVRGAPLSGANAIAGEWGHNPLPWPDDDERPGPLCYCGKRGCIETFLSGPGLALDHRSVTGQNVQAAEIVRFAEQDDARAEATLQRYERRLARALALVVNILDPHVIVLGGGLSNVRRLYARVPQLWGEWIFSDHVATVLLRNRHGDSGGVRGAAQLWPPASP